MGREMAERQRWMRHEAVLTYLGMKHTLHSSILPLEGFRGVETEVRQTTVGRLRIWCSEQNQGPNLRSLLTVYWLYCLFLHPLTFEPRPIARCKLYPACLAELERPASPGGFLI